MILGGMKEKKHKMAPQQLEWTHGGYFSFETLKRAIFFLISEEKFFTNFTVGGFRLFFAPEVRTMRGL